MQFEFDPKKNAVNKAKYGINFERAQALWAGRIITPRGEVVRLISVPLLGAIYFRPRLSA